MVLNKFCCEKLKTFMFWTLFKKRNGMKRKWPFVYHYKQLKSWFILATSRLIFELKKLQFRFKWVKNERYIHNSDSKFKIHKKREKKKCTDLGDLPAAQFLQLKNNSNYFIFTKFHEITFRTLNFFKPWSTLWIIIGSECCNNFCSSLMIFKFKIKPFITFLFIF